MFKSKSVKRISGKSDEVTLTFRCRGTIDDHYDEFLGNAAEAVVQLKGDYEDGSKVGRSKHADAIRDEIINALDHIFKAER